MKKIPTLFLRNPNDLRRVLTEVHPDCAWVVAGEGVATRKYDGTCVQFDGDRWWARREVKADKPAPAGFVVEQVDEVTGKTVGWEPADQSAFSRWLEVAIADLGEKPEPGTYELCGPKVNRNPEGYDDHVLVLHAEAEPLADVPLDHDGLEKYLADCPFEGIVWHHPDGRMAKLKRRDFPKDARL